jgi:hypothetical protein
LSNDPFREGAKAYHEYKSREDNPYEIGTVDNAVWSWGYGGAKNGDVDENGNPKEYGHDAE